MTSANERCDLRWQIVRRCRSESGVLSHSRQQIPLLRLCDGFGAVAHAEFGENLAVVPLYRTNGEDERFSDLTIGAPGGEQAKNILLPICQRNFANLPISLNHNRIDLFTLI